MSEHHPGGPASPSQPHSGHQAPPPPAHQPPPPPPPPGAGHTPPPAPGQQGYAQQAPYTQPGQQAPYGQQPPYAQPGPAQSQVGQPADLMTRILARLIDFLIVGAVGGVIYSIFLGMATVNLFTGRVSVWPFAVASLITGLLSLAYFTLLESSRGQTLGKMILKIKTFGPDGGNPTTEQALKRNAWTALSALGVIPVVGSTIGGLLQLGATIYIIVTINNNIATRQGWHDTFAGGTTVIKVG